MNERIRELVGQAKFMAEETINKQISKNAELDAFAEKFAELMIMEFCGVVKSTANELNEHYFKQGASEEEVLMRVNGALVVLGHIRARFKD